MYRFLIIFLTLSLVLGLAQIANAVEQDELNRVSNKFVCTCGCGNMLIGDCSCEKANQMKKVIGAKIDSGYSEEQISDELVSIYGLAILAEPPKKGFNLMAWIMPFAGVVAAGGLIFYSVRIWTDRRTERMDYELKKSEEEMDKYTKKLEKELEDWI